MLLVDTVQKRLVSDEECKAAFTGSKPYGEWLDRCLLKLRDLPAPEKKTVLLTKQQRSLLCKVFGYTYEDVREQILPMAQKGVEPTASMEPIYRWRLCLTVIHCCFITLSSSSLRSPIRRSIRFARKS